MEKKDNNFDYNNNNNKKKKKKKMKRMKRMKDEGRENVKIRNHPCRSFSK